jgi:hypothetical protein
MIVWNLYRSSMKKRAKRAMTFDNNRVSPRGIQKRTIQNVTPLSVGPATTIVTNCLQVAEKTSRKTCTYRVRFHGW